MRKRVDDIHFSTECFASLLCHKWILNFLYPGRVALPYMTSYTISKCGVDAFTDSLRREMLSWDIHVIGIEAGGHKTKLVDGNRLAQQWTSMWDELDDDVKQGYALESGHEGNETL